MRELPIRFKEQLYEAGCKTIWLIPNGFRFEFKRFTAEFDYSYTIQMMKEALNEWGFKFN